MEKITDTPADLWIGDIQDAREKALGDHGIEAVVSVCQDSIEDNLPDAIWYHHVNLADGAHDSYGRGDATFDTFSKGAIYAMLLPGIGKNTLVHCHAGQSRSATVCIAAIATINDLSYDEAYERVAQVRDIHPDPTMEKHAKEFSRVARDVLLEYIEEHTNGTTQKPSDDGE